MSSVSRGFAQIPSRSKYLFVPIQRDNGGFTAAQLANVVANSQSIIKSYDGTVLDTTDSNSLFNSIDNTVISINQGDVYRDLGKQLHVYENGVAVATFTYCQLVEDTNGELYEGVGDAPNIYMCTWQSAGSNCPSRLVMVKAVRTG
jgi:hypothetical protein